MKRVEQFVTMAICKSESARHALYLTKVIDVINHFARHRKFSPVPTNEAFPGSNAEEPVAALSVASGSKADAAGGTINHAIVVFFMDLCIRSKR